MVVSRLLLKKFAPTIMKKFSVIIFTCFLLSACASKPVLKNVLDDAPEKTINTPEKIEKIIKKNG